MPMPTDTSAFAGADTAMAVPAITTATIADFRSVCMFPPLPLAYWAAIWRQPPEPRMNKGWRNPSALALGEQLYAFLLGHAGHGMACAYRLAPAHEGGAGGRRQKARAAPPVEKDKEMKIGDGERIAHGEFAAGKAPLDVDIGHAQIFHARRFHRLEVIGILAGETHGAPHLLEGDVHGAGKPGQPFDATRLGKRVVRQQFR